MDADPPMLTFSKISWEEGTRATGKYSTLLTSQSNAFRMNQVPNMHLSACVAAFSGSGQNILKIVSSGHEIDVTDDGSLTVMLPTRGTLEVESEGKKQHARAGGVLILGPSRRRTRVVRPDKGDFEACLLKTPLSECESARIPSKIQLFGTGDPFIPAKDYAAKTFASLVDYIFSDLTSEAPMLAAERSSALAEALLLEHLRNLLQSNSDDSGSAGRLPIHKVREAEDFMRSHFSEPLGLAEIAAAAGVGSRQLQAIFRKVTGETPWSRLTAIRLEQARLQLLAGGVNVTVASIALECGFTHLGRFAEAYRFEFGESPSQTLRQAKDRPQ